MSVFAHMRRILLPLAFVVAIVTVAVPTCRLVGCNMATGTMPFMPFGGTHASSTCPGHWQFFTTPASTLPTGSNTVLLTLVAALFAAVVLVVPQAGVRPVLALVSNPPPPPEEPRGERFRA